MNGHMDVCTGEMPVSKGGRIHACMYVRMYGCMHRLIDKLVFY